MSFFSPGWSGIYCEAQSGFKLIGSLCLSFPSAEATDVSRRAQLTAVIIKKQRRERFGDRDANKLRGKRWQMLQCYCSGALGEEGFATEASRTVKTLVWLL